MSIQAMKRKGVIQYGSGRSGNKGYGEWVRQGPFGSTDNVVGHGAGFSLNGGTRNIGYIGRSSAFSKQGTPFVGQFPKGWGGCCGTYKEAEPFFNASEVIVLGDQAGFIKPSVLSTKGMLEKKYRYLFTGKYPNYWVQNTYTGNQTDSASQRVYIQAKAAAADTQIDVNNPEKYIGYRVPGGPLGCNPNKQTMAKLDFKIVSSTAGYTKQLYQPQTASQHTLRVQRKCQNPLPSQLPFPFNTPPASTNSGGDIHYAPPAILTPIYYTPPNWYTQGGVKGCTGSAVYNNSNALNAPYGKGKQVNPSCP